MSTANAGQHAGGTVNRRRWSGGLILTLGAFYVVLGFDSHGVAAWLGILGGLAIWASLAVAAGSRRVALALLGVGALAFALVTWWSVVTPLIAVLVLAIGVPILRSSNGRRHPPG